jgi:2-polyprenyl-3-methyl-5-hydroxy-6-metoxy-1,4-benzoquinol methylase
MMWPPMAPAFDDQAVAYDRWYSGSTPLGQLVDRVDRKGGDILPYDRCHPRAGRVEKEAARGRRVLEVGCGTGNISLELARRGARVVGLDLSGPMLALARAKPARRLCPSA